MPRSARPTARARDAPRNPRTANVAAARFPARAQRGGRTAAGDADDLGMRALYVLTAMKLRNGRVNVQYGGTFEIWVPPGDIAFDYASHASSQVSG